ncbi:MAG: hypothetical protein ACE5EK_03540, partial [Nitrospinales bacterium]
MKASNPYNLGSYRTCFLWPALAPILEEDFQFSTIRLTVCDHLDHIEFKGEYWEAKNWRDN